MGKEALEGNPPVGFVLRRSDQPEFCRHFTLQLGPKRVRIGRDETNEVCVTLNGVSSIHAELLVEERTNKGLRLHVRDLSVNGTGLKLPDGKKVVLSRGVDELVPHGAELLLPMRASKADKQNQQERRMFVTVELDSARQERKTVPKKRRSQGLTSDGAPAEKEHKKAKTAANGTVTAGDSSHDNAEAEAPSGRLDAASLELHNRKLAAADALQRTQAAISYMAKVEKIDTMEPLPHLPSAADAVQGEVEQVLCTAVGPSPSAPSATAPSATRQETCAPEEPFSASRPAAVNQQPIPLPVRHWSVTIDKSAGGPLGISISTSTLLIDKITPGGLVCSFNAANPGVALQKGDRVLSVNGQSAAAQIVGECKTQQLLQFILCREVSNDMAAPRAPPSPVRAASTVAGMALPSSTFPAQAAAMGSAIMAPAAAVSSTVAPTAVASAAAVAPAMLGMATAMMPPAALNPVAMAPVAFAQSTIAPATFAPMAMAPTTLAPTAMAPATFAPAALAEAVVAPTLVGPVAISPATMTPFTTAAAAPEAEGLNLDGPQAMPPARLAPITPGAPQPKGMRQRPMEQLMPMPMPAAEGTAGQQTPSWRLLAARAILAASSMTVDYQQRFPAEGTTDPQSEARPAPSTGMAPFTPSSLAPLSPEATACSIPAASHTAPGQVSVLSRNNDRQPELGACDVINQPTAEAALPQQPTSSQQQTLTSSSFFQDQKQQQLFLSPTAKPPPKQKLEIPPAPLLMPPLPAAPTLKPLGTPQMMPASLQSSGPRPKPPQPPPKPRRAPPGVSPRLPGPQEPADRRAPLLQVPKTPPGEPAPKAFLQVPKTPPKEPPPKPQPNHAAGMGGDSNEVFSSSTQVGAAVTRSCVESQLATDEQNPSSAMEPAASDDARRAAARKALGDDASSVSKTRSVSLTPSEKRRHKHKSRSRSQRRSSSTRRRRQSRRARSRSRSSSRSRQEHRRERRRRSGSGSKRRDRPRHEHPSRGRKRSRSQRRPQLSGANSVPIGSVPRPTCPSMLPVHGLGGPPLVLGGPPIKMMQIHSKMPGVPGPPPLPPPPPPPASQQMVGSNDMMNHAATPRRWSQGSGTGSWTPTQGHHFLGDTSTSRQSVEGDLDMSDL